MANQQEIKHRVDDLLARRILLEEFEDWFLPYSWNIHKKADASTQALVYSIDLKLSEYSSGDLDEKELRRALTGIIDTREHREAPSMFIVNGYLIDADMEPLQALPRREQAVKSSLNGITFSRQLMRA